MNSFTHRSNDQISVSTREEWDWCVVRQLPTMRSLIVGRFLSRTEAEHCCSFMKRMYPSSFFEVMFDASLD
ncbi:MAG: hypothetical protein D6742_01630 [Cyanobacteria bacterium J069]|nr:MAG: hypothetical protein D6742_01630 [Cyanobacteria bacterium J069]